MILLRVDGKSFQRRNFVLILDFFLVFDDLSIKFVHQKVDRGVHIGILTLHENVLAGEVDVGFDFLAQFLDAQNHVYVDHVIEMPVDSGHLGGNVITYGWCDFEVMAGHVQIHLPISFLKVATQSIHAAEPVQVNDINDITFSNKNYLHLHLPSHDRAAAS